MPQFRLVTRADGNTRDLVNQREVVFSYGLPTALQTYGVTAELKDFHGIDFYGELNVNTQYLKYPTPDRKTRRAFSGIAGESRGLGFMVNASWRKGPFSLFGEGFGMDDSYATSVLPLDRSGLPDFSPENTRQLYDFVDDNDDNDRHPDQLRTCRDPSCRSGPRRSGTSSNGASPTPRYFPGTTRTAISYPTSTRTTTGAPQLLPDYDEPFVRYRSDRPQFLFGIDLNNNGWPERFENDDEPDLPYKKDHWGYNLFGTAEIAPGPRCGSAACARICASQRGGTTPTTDDPLRKGRPAAGEGAVLRHAQESGGHDRRRPRAVDRSRSLLRAAGQFPRPAAGGARPSRRRRHLDQYRLRRLGAGLAARLVDPAPCKVGNLAPAGLRNAATLDSSGDTLEVFDRLGVEGRNGRARSGFFGVINKAEYLFFWRQVAIAPRLKSELLRATPFSRDLGKRRSWDGIFSLQFEVPFLSSSRIRLGWEQRLFYDTRAGEEEMASGERTGDFHGTALAAQLTNIRDYLGYALTTQAGIRIDRRSFELSGGGDESGTSGLLFLTMFAALR